MIKILYAQHCLVYHTIAHHVRYILQRAGIDAIICNTFPEEDEEGVLWFCIWNDFPKLPKNSIVFNMEPMSSINYPKLLNQIANSPPIRHLITYSFADAEKLATITNSFTVIPYGFSTFHNWLYNFRTIDPTVKDIDILFYGAYTERRRRITDEIRKLCEERKYTFMYPVVFDETMRANLVSRSRIVLAIASEPGLQSKSNDLARLSYLISNKVFVLADHIGDSQVEDKLRIPFIENGQTFQSEIVKYLSNEKLRNEIVETAYTHFRNDFPFEEQILNTIKKFV